MPLLQQGPEPKAGVRSSEQGPEPKAGVRSSEAGNGPGGTGLKF